MTMRAIGAAAALSVGCAALFVTLAPVAGQSTGSAGAGPALRAARAPAVPRTADGRPSLEGVWSFATLTPLERPPEFAGKPTLTAAEAAEIEKQLVELRNTDRRGNSAATDIAAAYNNFWWDRGTTLAEVDGVKRTSLIIDPPDGRIPPLTPAGQAKADARAKARAERPADGPEDRPLVERCLSFNAGPPMLPSGYNNNVQVFQSSTHVAIVNEMIHDARLVPLDGRPHRPQNVRLWLGDPVGRWEGDTLVVDSTNFSDKTNFRGADESLHLVERFTRVSADTLLYQFTIDNPTAFTKPWTAVLPMKKLDERIFEYACHEANYAMEGILKGARAEEKGR